MPFRERVKRAFGRSGASSDASGESRKESWDKTPPMKYRRPVDPVHKERLNAFNFSNAWRRKSEQSQVSPLASHAASRRNSAISGRKSVGFAKRGDSSVGRLMENADDEADVANVGLSRRNTHDHHQHRVESDESIDPLTANPEIWLNGDEPFSQHELDLALQRSNVFV